MTSEDNSIAPADVAVNPFTAADVEAILSERGWMGDALAPTAEQKAWCERAAQFLGPQSADRAALADLLGLVFHYDAVELMNQVETHVTMSRHTAREALRQLVRLVLDIAPFTSERFKEVVTSLKENLDIRGRELFQPLRLALAGRAGEGDLDRVILLLDEAAAAGFAVPVKTVRGRALEFCAALD
jgi:glutamyl/glutaminyl-tRNA synthetase